MSAEQSFAIRASTWGQGFEVFVKRGVLACLAAEKLLSDEHPVAKAWRNVKLLQVYERLERAFGEIDPEVIEFQRATASHYAGLGYLLGFTVMREYLARLASAIERKELVIRGLWCPLTLPTLATEKERPDLSRAFHVAFGLPGDVDPALGDRGQPANSDFTLWLAGKSATEHLLVLEFSFDSFGTVDFRSQDGHLAELERHRRIQEGRGVFARISAELNTEGFRLAPGMRLHLAALSSDDKPLFKLCQASAYVERTAKLLTRHNLATKTLQCRALAVTPNGLESIAAQFERNVEADARRVLLAELGEAYCGLRKVGEDNAANLANETESVFNAYLNRLPTPLYRGMKELRDIPKPGENIHLELSETLTDFWNPASARSRQEALELIPADPAIDSYLGRSAKEAISEKLSGKSTTLRDLHASAIVCGLEAAKPGQLNVLALEGNPGIGKTTAVQQYLSRRGSGFLFLYVSPRVVINRHVTHELSHAHGELSGILTVTSNAQLISSAEYWYAKNHPGDKKHIDGAVVADGVPALIKPSGSILVLAPEEEEKIDNQVATSRMYKETLSEDEDVILERSLPGVLRAMASTTKNLLRLNPEVNRCALTAALQGFRRKSQSHTTIQGLSELFHNKVHTRAGINERRAFAKRFPLVVVMVDEIAGDGAGAPFVAEIAQWLKEQFLDFEDSGKSAACTAVLIVSDASLANPAVMRRYLDSGDRAPNKILLSKSSGSKAFDLEVSQLRVGNAWRPALHVMANSYPASELVIDYRINLTALRLEETPEGRTQDARAAIRKGAGEALLASAVREIARALGAQPGQVIYFAQDKLFLGALRQALVEQQVVDPKRVAILDSSVPGWKRKKLLQEQNRDAVRVFLMTSSGARGVSFPRTTWIIASVPRFSIEASLMELAQLAYRGRGMATEDGMRISFDNLPRRLVLLVDDFIVHEEINLDRRQWLRRAIDVLTFVVMLRATIFTRIRGDAGLGNQPLALVPVGMIGLEDMLTLMSRYVTQFLKECQNFLSRNEGSEAMNGTVKNAAEATVEVFSKYKLDSQAKDTERISWARIEDARKVLYDTTLPIASLLANAPDISCIPQHIYCAGPVVFERLEDASNEEVIAIEGWSDSVKKKERNLYGLLRHIRDAGPDLPSTLRTPAASLLRILSREKWASESEFKTRKVLKNSDVWVALPVGYPQFMIRRHDQDERLTVISDAAGWHDSLTASLKRQADVMPPIAHYASFPWTAAVCPEDPLRLDLVFDDRYLLASSELNLLNTLLLNEHND